MPKPTLAALLLCLPLTAVLPGPAPARPPVRQLIEQLGDRDYFKRRQAEDGLRAEGARALAALKQALNHPDAEVRRRVRELVPALETRALLAPKRVTLTLTDRPVSEALDAITRQTGYKISLGEAPAGVFSFDLKDVPFWEALDRVGRDAGLVLRPPGSDQGLRLSKRPGYTAHVSYDGPIRFTADSIQLHRELEFGLAGPAAETPSRSEILTLSFTVYAEPKLPIVGMGEPRLTAAYDTEKRSMLPLGNPLEAAERELRRSRCGILGRCLSAGASVHLQLPSRTSAGIRVVRGTVPLALLAQKKQVVVTDKLLSTKGTSAKVGTTSITFDNVARRPDGVVEVELTVAEQGPGVPSDGWHHNMSDRFEVQDDKGRTCPMPRRGCSSWSGSPNQVRVWFKVGPGARLGPPSKLIFRDWTTREHLASFEFKELPLP